MRLVSPPPAGERRGTLLVGTALLAGFRGVRNKRWKGAALWKGLGLIGLLHLLQPMARMMGRIKGRSELRKAPQMFSDTDLLEGNLEKRDLWLNNLLEHMRSCGWVVRRASEWGDADIEVLGPTARKTKEGGQEFSILLKSDNRKKLNTAAKAVIGKFKRSKDVKIVVDVDPA